MAVSSTVGSSIRLAEPFAEDVLFRKIVCCVPVLGAFVSLQQENSLRRQASQPQSPQRLIALIHIKNHYKIANVVRNFIVVAILVAAIAHGIIPSATIGILAYLGFAAFNIYLIFKNKDAKSDLLEHGSESKLMIH